MSGLLHSVLTESHLSSRPVQADRPSVLVRAIETLGVWRDRIREKRALELLDERDWHDFGASRSDVLSELRRPFWRAPPAG